MKFWAKILIIAMLVNFAVYVVAEARKGAVADSSITKKISKLKYDGLQFPVCKSVGLLSQDDYKDNQAFWDKAINECGVDVKIMPEAGWMSTFVSSVTFGKVSPEVLAKDKATLDFLKKIGDEAGGHLAANNAHSTCLLKCAENDKNWFTTADAKMLCKEASGKSYGFDSCSAKLGTLRKGIEKNYAEYRHLLGMTKMNELVLTPKFKNDYPLLATQFDNRINANPILGAPGDLANMAYDPLTNEEKDAVLKEFAKNTKEIENSFKENLAKRSKMADELLAKGASREQVKKTYPEVFLSREGKDYTKTAAYRSHMENERAFKTGAYKEKINEMMMRSPVMAYEVDHKASNEKLAVAIRKVLNNGLAEVKKLRERQASGKFSELVTNLKYGPVVKEHLEKNQNACAVATGVATYLEDKGTADAIGILGSAFVGMGGGMSLVAALGRGAAGAKTLAGMGTIAWSTIGTAPTVIGIHLHDTAAYNAAVERALNVLDTENYGKMVGDLKEVHDAEFALNVTRSLAPLDVAGLGLYTKAWAAAKGLGIVASGVAAGAGVKATEVAAARALVKESLQAKGVSGAEVEKLLKDLASKDEKVAASAARTMVRKLGISEDELEVVALAAKKNLFSRMSGEKVMNILTKELGIKTEKAASREAVRILNETNPALFNEANRETTTRAIAEVAKYGPVTDPKLIAKNVQDWAGTNPEALEGLVDVYKEARKKLKFKPREYSQEVREQAIRDVIKEKAVAAGILTKSSTKQEIDEVVDGMFSCGVGKRAS